MAQGAAGCGTGVIAARTADGAEDYLRDLRVRGQTVGDAFLVLGNEKEQFGCRRKLTQEFLELTEQPRRLIKISGGMIGGEEADRRDCRRVGTKWAIVVSNHRPRSYQDRALTN